MKPSHQHPADSDCSAHFTPVARPRSGWLWTLPRHATLMVLALASAPAARAVDTTPPVISLNGVNPATIFVGSTYTDAGATAVDNADGSVPVNVNAVGVNANAVGTYTVNFSALDAATNSASATRTVNVVSSPVWAENFLLPGGFAGTVNAIAETSDAIFYGGRFIWVGKLAANNIVRVDKTTGAVTPLGSAAQNGTNATVTALAVIGTDLYVGGNFTTVSSSTQVNAAARSVAKWSTTASTWTELGNGTNGGVNALAVSGMDLYVGGNFDTVGSISARTVAKWSTTTGSWSPLGSATENGTDHIVFALAVSGTDIYVGGTFTTVTDSSMTYISANKVAKWSTATSTWTPLGSAAQNGTDNDVNVLAVIGTNIYVGGQFRRVSDSTQVNVSANYMARWSTTTSTWAPLGGATQNGTGGTTYVGTVYSLAVSGTDLYVGGSFATVSSSTQVNASANRVAKWSTTTGTWAPLGSATQNGTNSFVYALAVSGTNLYVGGAFSTVSSSTQNAVPQSVAAKWSAAGGSWTGIVPVLPFGSGINGKVNVILDMGSFVYVGGSFTRAGNVVANNIVRWTKATRTWTPLGSATQNGTNNTVNALAVSGTDLYVGGGFTNVSSSTQVNASANCVAKWSTTTSTWAPLGSAAQNGTGNVVYALAVSGTDLYAGGYFTAVSSSTQNGASVNRVAKWSTITGTWTPLGSAAQNGTNSFVFALAVSGTDLYVGGGFSTVSSSTQSGASARNVAKWSTTTGTWAPLGSAVQNGTNSGVTALAVSGTDLYVGGSFSTVSSSTLVNVSAKYIAKWSTTTSTWAPLGSATQNGVGVYVSALAVSGTDLYVGGQFRRVSSSTQNEASANRVAKWSTTAGTWAALGSAGQRGAERDERVGWNE